MLHYIIIYLSMVIHLYLVVEPNPRKIWVRQLGWWNSQWKNKNHVPNHQPVVTWFYLCLSNKKCAMGSMCKLDCWTFGVEKCTWLSRFHPCSVGLQCPSMVHPFYIHVHPWCIHINPCSSMFISFSVSFRITLPHVHPCPKKPNWHKTETHT